MDLRDGKVKEEFSDDDFKFKNSDVKLDDVVQKNGGHFIMSNIDLLFDTPKRTNNGCRDNV
jgi:hypothetical protein